MLSLRKGFWIAGAMAAALATTAAARSYRAEEVRQIARIAHELEDNARSLAEAARQERYATGRVDNYALAGFEGFLAGAARFHDQAERFTENSRRIDETYAELRRAYEVAYRYYPTIRDTARNVEIKRRAADTMNSLVEAYERPIRVPGPPPRRHVDWHEIDGLARAIERQTDSVYEAAHDDAGEHWRGRRDSRDRGLASLKRLESIADDYRSVVSRSQDRPDATYEGMRRLADAHEDSQRWIGLFDSRTRERFNDLGKLVWRLKSAYESPRRPIGPEPWRRDYGRYEGRESIEPHSGEPTSHEIGQR